MKRLTIVLISAAFIFLEACKDDPSCTKLVTEAQLRGVDLAKLKSDSLAIVEYLAANSILNTQIKNNVRYRITTLGSGATPCLESIVRVKYRGQLMKTGTVFDPDPASTVNWEERIVQFRLNDRDLIVGWKIVMPDIPAGTRLTLYIPSGYGYGISGFGGGVIPANANLVFDIELVEVL